MPLRYVVIIWELDAQRYALLLGMADLVCLRFDPDQLFRDLAPRLRPVVPFDFVNFALFDSARKTMKMYFWEGAERPHEPLEARVDEAAVGWVWRNQSELVIDDLLADDRFEPGLRWLHERKLRSYCVFPLTTVQQKLGALGFGSRLVSAFSSDDIQFLHRVAEMVALCVDSTLDEPTLAEERARLRLLLEVDAPHIGASDLGESLASILGSMKKWAVHDYVGVYLYDEASQSLRLHMPDSQAAENLVPQGLTPIEGTLAGQAFRSRRSVVLDHSGLAALPFASVKRGMEKLGVRSLYLAPLVSAKGPLGVLKVARREDHPFSPSCGPWLAEGWRDGERLGKSQGQQSGS